MEKKELIAPCGMDCFNCDDYEANITIEIRIAKSIKLKIPLNETGCNGCNLEKGRERFNVNCETYECIKDKRVSYCYECIEFPCQKLLPTQKGSLYPHNMKLYNLMRMKQIGIEKWILETPMIRRLYYDGEFQVGKGPFL